MKKENNERQTWSKKIRKKTSRRRGRKIRKNRRRTLGKGKRDH